MRSTAWNLPIVAILLVVLFGCNGGDSSATNARENAAGQDRASLSALPDGFDVRLVSFSPAISRTLVDLGLEDFIVGRTPYCDALDRRIPIVGDLLDVNYELLVRVRPTHVLVQPPAAGIDPALVRLARNRAWSLNTWRLDSIDDIRQIIEDLPGAIASDQHEARQELEARAVALRSAIDEALVPLEENLDFDVLLLFGLDPPTAFGRGTYADDVLTSLGGRNAVEHQGYPEFTLEDVVRINPGAIILFRPVREAAADAPAALAQLPVKAARDERLAILRSPEAFMPSSGIAEVAREMKALLAQLAASERAESWRGDGR